MHKVLGLIHRKITILQSSKCLFLLSPVQKYRCWFMITWHSGFVLDNIELLRQCKLHFLLHFLLSRQRKKSLFVDDDVTLPRYNKRYFLYHRDIVNIFVLIYDSVTILRYSRRQHFYTIAIIKNKFAWLQYCVFSINQSQYVLQCRKNIKCSVLYHSITMPLQINNNSFHITAIMAQLKLLHSIIVTI